MRFYQAITLKRKFFLTSLLIFAGELISGSGYLWIIVLVFFLVTLWYLIKIYLENKISRINLIILFAEIIVFLISLREINKVSSSKVLQAIDTFNDYRTYYELVNSFSKSNLLVLNTETNKTILDDRKILVTNFGFPDCYLLCLHPEESLRIESDELFNICKNAYLCGQVLSVRTDHLKLNLIYNNNYFWAFHPEIKEIKLNSTKKRVEVYFNSPSEMRKDSFLEKKNLTLYDCLMISENFLSDFRNIKKIQEKGGGRLDKISILLHFKNNSNIRTGCRITKGPLDTMVSVIE